MDIARVFTTDRITRCCTIMGRKESDKLSAAQIMYPCMQCADIFFLKADICQLGMDQRKVNMLAREYCDAAKIKFKPVILSHHMLMGLKEGMYLSLYIYIYIYHPRKNENWKSIKNHYILFF